MSQEGTPLHNALHCLDPGRQWKTDTGRQRKLG